MLSKKLLNATDTMLAVTTLSFDIAATEIYLPLIAGGRVVIASREVASDGVQLDEVVGEFRCDGDASHAGDLEDAYRCGLAG